MSNRGRLSRLSRFDHRRDTGPQSWGECRPRGQQAANEDAVALTPSPTIADAIPSP